MLKEEDLLYFSRNYGKGGNGIGKITSDGFWVLKESYIYPEVAKYTAQGIKKAPEQYADKIDKNLEKLYTAFQVSADPSIV